MEGTPMNPEQRKKLSFTNSSAGPVAASGETVVPDIAAQQLEAEPKTERSRFLEDRSSDNVLETHKVMKYIIGDNKIISQEEEEQIVENIKGKMPQEKIEAPAITTAAYTLKQENVEMYDQAAEIFEFHPNLVSLDTLISYRYDIEHMKSELNLSGACEQQYEYYCEISKCRDQKQYKRENTDRTYRPDVLRARILGTESGSLQLKTKEHELLQILNKYSVRESSQIINAVQDLFTQVKEAQPSDINQFAETVFSNLYDKACLEHAFIEIYAVVIEAFVNPVSKRIVKNDYLQSYSKFKRDFLLKEILTGKTYLSEYHSRNADDALTKMYKENNYLLHFKGCVLFSAELFKLSETLISSEELITALFSALSRDLRMNEVDQSIINESHRIVQLDNIEEQDMVTMLSGFLISKAQKTRFEYITLVIEALHISYDRLERCTMESKTKVRFMALQSFIFGLTEVNADALVIFKAKELKRIKPAPTAVISVEPKGKNEGQRSTDRGNHIIVAKWDDVIAFWEHNGLLATICDIYRTDAASLSQEIYKNSTNASGSFINRFITSCFSKGSAPELFSEKYELLHELDAKTEQIVSDLINQAFIKHYEGVDDKCTINYMNFIIDKCLLQRDLIYQYSAECLKEHDARAAEQFLKELNHRVVVKAYNEILDEYEDSFDEQQVAAFKERIEKGDFEAQYEEFPGLFEELRSSNYTYFKQPDFVNNKEFEKHATTPFEDLAIYKICRIYFGEEHPDMERLKAVSDNMKVFTQIFGIPKQREAFCHMCAESGFDIGAVSLEVRGMVMSTHPRAHFYNQKSVIFALLSGDDDISATTLEKFDPEGVLGESLAFIVIETAYEAVKSKKDAKSRFMSFISLIKDKNCVNPQAAKALLTAQNKKGDRYGSYQVSW